MKYPPRLVDSAISTFIDRQYIMKHQRRARIQQTESCSSYLTLQRPEISWPCQETTGKATKCNRFQTKFNPFTRVQKLEKISLFPKPTPPVSQQAKLWRQTQMPYDATHIISDTRAAAHTSAATSTAAQRYGNMWKNSMVKMPMNCFSVLRKIRRNIIPYYCAKFRLWGSYADNLCHIRHD